jgi:hypothetical protein
MIVGILPAQVLEGNLEATALPACGMKFMRELVNVGGNGVELLAELWKEGDFAFVAGSDFILAFKIDLAGEERDALPDVVVQVATDAAAFFFLRLDQMSGEALKFLVALIEAGFRCLLGADIADHADDKRRASVITVEKRNADLSPHLGTIAPKESLLQSVAGFNP